MERCQDLEFCFVIIFSSISNVPFWGSNNPKIISTVVVLPLPVAPTIPTVVFAEIFILIPLIAVRDAFG